jgi:hypothetical protein
MKFGIVDMSNVDGMEARKLIASAEEAREKLVAEMAATEAPFRERIAAIQAEAVAATVEIRRRIDAHDEQVIGVFGPALVDDEGDPRRCCLSGLYLLEGDRIAKDSAGNSVLVAVVPNWPDESPDDDAAEDDAPEFSDLKVAHG